MARSSDQFQWSTCCIFHGILSGVLKKHSFFSKQLGDSLFRMQFIFSKVKDLHPVAILMGKQTNHP